jgi:hypothetical protein
MEFMEEIIHGGAILDDSTVNDTDLILWADMFLDLKLNREENQRQVEFEYNQWAREKTRYCCTIFSSMKMISYLKNKQFTDEDFDEVIDKMVTDWKLNLKSWARLADAIDYTRNRWNAKNPNDKVVSYQINLADKKLMDLINKDRLMYQIGYLLSSDIVIETENTGVASKWDYPKTTGHRVNKWWFWTIDNYKWKRKHNRYEFQKFEELVKNWVVYVKGYIILNA